MDVLHTTEIEYLFNVILGLENADECFAFFEDVCTVKELQDMAMRLQVARMLKAGRSYQEISADTGASTATISRVNKCLMYGSGYKLALGRENADKTENTDR